MKSFASPRTSPAWSAHFATSNVYKLSTQERITRNTNKEKYTLSGTRTNKERRAKKAVHFEKSAALHKKVQKSLSRHDENGTLIKKTQDFGRVSYKHDTNIVERVRMNCAEKFGNKSKHNSQETDLLLHLEDMTFLTKDLVLLKERGPCVLSPIGIVGMEQKENVDHSNKKGTDKISAVTKKVTKNVAGDFKRNATSLHIWNGSQRIILLGLSLLVPFIAVIKNVKGTISFTRDYRNVG